MASRAETINHLRSYNDVEDMGEGSFKIEWKLEGGRSQVVFAYVTDDFLALTSPFAHEDDVTAAKAIGLSKIFGIAKVGEYFAFRHVVLLADLDESEIVHGMMYVAVAADGAESEVGGDRF